MCTRLSRKEISTGSAKPKSAHTDPVAVLGRRNGLVHDLVQRPQAIGRDLLVAVRKLVDNLLDLARGLRPVDTRLAEVAARALYGGYVGALADRRVVGDNFGVEVQRGRDEIDVRLHVLWHGVGVAC